MMIMKIMRQCLSEISKISAIFSTISSSVLTFSLRSSKHSSYSSSKISPPILPSPGIVHVTCLLLPLTAVRFTAYSDNQVKGVNSLFFPWIPCKFRTNLLASSVHPYVQTVALQHAPANSLLNRHRTPDPWPGTHSAFSSPPPSSHALSKYGERWVSLLLPTSSKFTFYHKNNNPLKFQNSMALISTIPHHALTQILKTLSFAASINLNKNSRRHLLDTLEKNTQSLISVSSQIHTLPANTNP